MTVEVRYGGLSPYLTLDPAEPPRPLIAVKLQRGGVSLTTYGLIDSGADSALFNSQFAQSLGFTLTPGAGRKTEGIGGEITEWYFDVYLRVGGKRFLASVGFSPDWPATFGLLGRDDFFEAFAVGFDQRGQRVLYHALP
ncbi:MAG: hypothetical protein ACHQ50_13720 [Fimbriimonadales bacterium]